MGQIDDENFSDNILKRRQVPSKTSIYR